MSGLSGLAGGLQIINQSCFYLRCNPGVTNVTCLRNPIDAARLVMDKSPHVLLSGVGTSLLHCLLRSVYIFLNINLKPFPGAETFALAHGASAAEASYFHTERRWSQLQACLEHERSADDQQQQQQQQHSIALDHSEVHIPQRRTRPQGTLLLLWSLVVCGPTCHRRSEAITSGYRVQSQP